VGAAVRVNVIDAYSKLARSITGLGPVTGSPSQNQLVAQFRQSVGWPMNCRI
jgi:hypothetical protein